MIRGTLIKAVHLWELAGRPRVTSLAKSKEKASHNCPSSSPHHGGRAFAWRDQDGTLTYGVPNSEEKIDSDNQIRFVGRCVQQRCVYWAGNCQLGAMVTRVAIRTKKEDDLLADQMNPVGLCPIKNSCRWIHENGPSVCIGCTEVDYIMSKSTHEPQAF